jgi:cysteine-rich repeat protein
LKNASAGEQCDASGESAKCDVDCTKASCGDGLVNVAAGETCDDSGESAACNVDCTAAACGDGVVNASAGEACDDAGESPTCDMDCSFAECGDEVFNQSAGEECDGELEYVGGGAPVTITENFCVSSCKTNVCGDGIVFKFIFDDPYAPSAFCSLYYEAYPEICDENGWKTQAQEDCDSGGIDTETCDADCSKAECGDGHLNQQNFEECDDGNLQSGDGCSVNCEIE